MKDLLAHQPLAGEDVMRCDVFEGLDHPPSDAVLRHVKQERVHEGHEEAERASARAKDGTSQALKGALKRTICPRVRWGVSSAHASPSDTTRSFNSQKGLFRDRQKTKTQSQTGNSANIIYMGQPY